ncbi:MAG: hypothetical protein ACI8Y4_002965, partial [Candidatus Poriferisodalaceae bacterium]
RHVAETVGLEPVWEIALAGLLVHLGWIAVPSDIVEAHVAGKPLTSAEAVMFEEAYATSVRLVGRIPRLDGVGSIIRDSRSPSGQVDAATVVRTVAEFDRLCMLGTGPAQASKDLAGSYPDKILSALGSWEGVDEDVIRKEIDVRQIVVGMVAEKDIVTLTGILLVKAGSDITETIVQQLRNFADRQGIEEPISVSVRNRS